MQNQPFQFRSTFEQVTDFLRHRIKSGQLQGNMPGVHALSAELGVHHTTAAEAFSHGLEGLQVVMDLGEVRRVDEFHLWPVVHSIQHNYPAAERGRLSRIRLLCDSFVLNEISDRTPPGPPHSVTPVGFSWDSGEFPDHLSAAAPLILEISSLGNANDDGGSLDHVQATSLGGVER